MDARYIALAVPFFFLLIGGELLLNRRRGDPRYVFHDSIANLSHGVGQQVLAIFFTAAEVGGYVLVWEHFRVADISPRSPIAWLVLIFALDLCYYAYHRASHRVNFLWATHAVHHQSEEYNLSVALRQSWFSNLTAWLFYLPLAIAGFPPLMYVAMHTFNTLYQFWIHTRAVGRMGPLERFLNTPSHHRVHHGIDPRYIDKNYAGIFIIWDRLLGTFTPETGEPVYGTVKPLASWNPVWGNLEPWVRMGRLAAASRRLRDWLLVWFMPPEWRPAHLGGRVVIPEVSRATQRKYDVPAGTRLDFYVGVHFALIVAGATLLLYFGAGMTALAQGAMATFILVSLLAWGGLFEARPWALPLEYARLAAAPALGWLVGGPLGAAIAAPAALAAGLILYVVWRETSAVSVVERDSERAPVSR